MAHESPSLPVPILTLGLLLLNWAADDQVLQVVVYKTTFLFTLYFFSLLSCTYLGKLYFY